MMSVSSLSVESLMDLTDIFQVLEYPLRFLEPLEFSEVKKDINYKPRVLAFGVAGVGKSSTGNQLYRLTNKEKQRFKAPFESKACAEGVTRKLQVAESEELVYIDTCGFNDHDKRRSDSIISQEIWKNLRGLCSVYFNGLLFITMPDTGSRIEEPHIKTLMDFLLGFTQTYKRGEKNSKNFPFVKVLVTNFSKIENDDDDNLDFLPEEDSEETDCHFWEKI